jgi:hypothetical protein
MVQLAGEGSCARQALSISQFAVRNAGGWRGGRHSLLGPPSGARPAAADD